jgi:hypothetical protein
MPLAPFAALLLATAAPAAAPADEADIVVVGNSGQSYRLTPAQLRAAAEAFTANRAQFAPAARLIWQVIPAGAADSLALTLRCGDNPLPIEIGAKGRFVLPLEPLRTGQCRLTSNRARKGGGLRISPIALSPGSERDDYRFGDARLSCRVAASLALSDAGLMVRGIFAAVGGCDSRRIGIYIGSERPIASVSISQWPGPVEIRKDGKAYRVPLYERAIGNEARVRVSFR